MPLKKLHVLAHALAPDKLFPGSTQISQGDNLVKTYSTFFHIHLWCPPPANVTPNLPILQHAADGYKAWHACHELFPKTAKYSLGTKIDVLYTDVIELILTAGFTSKEQKLPIVRQASVKLDLLKFFVQIAWEIKCLDNQQYAALAQSLSSVGKMIGAWLKGPRPANEKPADIATGFPT